MAECMYVRICKYVRMHLRMYKVQIVRSPHQLCMHASFPAYQYQRLMHLFHVLTCVRTYVRMRTYVRTHYYGVPMCPLTTERSTVDTSLSASTTHMCMYACTYMSNVTYITPVAISHEATYVVLIQHDLTILVGRKVTLHLSHP